MGKWKRCTVKCMGANGRLQHNNQGICFAFLLAAFSQYPKCTGNLSVAPRNAVQMLLRLVMSILPCRVRENFADASISSLSPILNVDHPAYSSLNNRVASA